MMLTMPLTPTGSPAVRNVRGGKLTGYLALWGDTNTRDCVGTWFDRNNKPNLGLSYGGEEYGLLPLRLMYEHAQDKEIGTSVIGKITRLGEDDLGIWFEGELDQKSKHYNRVKREIENGELSTSSASSTHLAAFDNDNRFKDWVLAEHTLTRSPCETRMPTVDIRSKWGHWAGYHHGKNYYRRALRMSAMQGAKQGVYRALRGMGLDDWDVVRDIRTGRLFLVSPKPFRTTREINNRNFKIVGNLFS